MTTTSDPGPIPEFLRRGEPSKFDAAAAAATAVNDAPASTDSTAPLPQPKSKRGGARPGAGRKGAKSKPGASSAAGAAGDPAADEMHEACRKSAIRLCGLVFMLTRALGGDEWHPDKEEFLTNVDAWTALFEEQGGVDLPPGLAVVGAAAAFALPRMTREPTRQKIGIGLYKMWEAIKRLFKRKPKIQNAGIGTKEES